MNRTPVTFHSLTGSSPLTMRISPELVAGISMQTWWKREVVMDAYAPGASQPPQFLRSGVCKR
jgi:hypothetical protein